MEETKFTLNFKDLSRQFCLGLVMLCFFMPASPNLFGQTCPVNLIEITNTTPCGDGQIFLQNEINVNAATNTQAYDNATYGFSGTTTGTVNIPTSPTPPGTPGLTDARGLTLVDQKVDLNESDRYQSDGWLLVPPGVTTINFNFNNTNPNNPPNQAAALWVGDSISGTAGMTKVLEHISPSGAAGSAAPLYTTTPYTIPATAAAIGNCGWRAIRFRHFLADDNNFAISRVKWDVYGASDFIPNANIHAVTGADLDDNLDAIAMRPEYESVRFAYQDAGGALFALGGGAAPALSSCETSCIAQTNATALGCNPIELTDQPVCPLEVVEITTIRPIPGTGPYTQFLAGGDDCGTGGADAGDMVAIRLSCFFNEFEGTTCLPTRTGMSVVAGVTTIGANDVAVGGNNTAGNDVDEGVQQDAWLVIPNGVNSIKFQVNNGAGIDYSALYLGKDYEDLKFVGEAETGANVAPLPLEVDYGIPCDVEVASCGRRIIRLRYYTVDDGVGFNTILSWDIGDGNNFVNVPTAAIYPAASATDNVLPTIGTTTGATVQAVRDSKGDYYTARNNFGLPVATRGVFATENRLFPDECDSIVALDLNSCRTDICNEVRDLNQTYCAPIPTMSQWGLMIFGLLMLNLGLIFIREKEYLL